MELSILYSSCEKSETPPQSLERFDCILWIAVKQCAAVKRHADMLGLKLLRNARIGTLLESESLPLI